MARSKFNTAQAHIVVDTAGFFDVFASADRPSEQRPAYRGELADLGHGVVAGTRLAMPPSSDRLAAVVTAWSELHGADALAGKMGRGRQGEGVLTPVEQKAADEKAAAKKAERAEQKAADKKTGKKS